MAEPMFTDPVSTPAAGATAPVTATTPVAAPTENETSTDLDTANLTPAQPADQTAEQGAPKQKILVVEDEPDARAMFVDLLETAGKYDVSSAVDGNDAIAKAGAEKFDLILLDIVMPNKDGIETLQDIKADKAKFGEPIVVMLTNISGDAAVEKAMELGAAGYKLKIGTEPEELLKGIEEFLAGKQGDFPAQ